MVASPHLVANPHLRTTFVLVVDPHLCKKFEFRIGEENAERNGLLRLSSFFFPNLRFIGFSDMDPQFVFLFVLCSDP